MTKTATQRKAIARAREAAGYKNVQGFAPKPEAKRLQEQLDKHKEALERIEQAELDRLAGK